MNAHAIRTLLATIAIAVTIGGTTPGAAAPDEAAPPYRAKPFEIEGPVGVILTVDLDRDGLKDFVRAADRRVLIYFQRPTGFDFDEPDVDLELPGHSVGWDLDETRAAGEPARHRIVALLDGKTIEAWPIDATTRRLGERETLVSGVAGFLPRGGRHLDFVREVNGDEHGDLVVPGSGVFHVYVRAADGSFSSPLSVNADVDLSTRLSAGDGGLTERVGQSIALPVLQLRDLNGDGARDVISRTSERLDVYLARNGADFPREPSWSLDLAAIRERLGEFDPDRLDFSNLTGVVALTYQAELEDVDRDDIADLLVREGGKILLFGGTRDGVDMKRPRQVLKSGGNVLTAVLHDEDDDGLRDLWLVRVEAVSIGDVFLWLVASGSIDFEAFLYRNEKRRFARRPSRKITVTVKFPSLLSLIKYADEVEKKLKEEERVPTEKVTVRPLLGGNVGEKEARDLLALRGGAVQCWFGKARRAERAGRLGEYLNYSRDRDRYTLDIKELVDKLVLGADPALAGVEGAEPDLEIKIPDAGRGSDMIILDLNGDPHDDVIVFSDRTRDTLKGCLVLSGRDPEPPELPRTVAETSGNVEKGPPPAKGAGESPAEAPTESPAESSDRESGSEKRVDKGPEPGAREDREGAEDEKRDDDGDEPPLLVVAKEVPELGGEAGRGGL